jgi:predicted transglutaminase-like cysteine proteinase
MPTRKELYYHLMLKLQDQSKGIKLTEINKFFNHFSYKNEITDYWKCQEEFLEDGYGDCDDFAIAKYFALLNLGFSESSLKLAYVHILVNNKKEAHMVLLYIHSDTLTIVLDNYNKKIHRLDNRKDIEIIYTFNNEHIYFKGQTLINNHTKWLSLKDRLSDNSINI